MTELPLVFGWKPTKCQNCKNFGHVAPECRLTKSKKIWVPITHKNPDFIEKIIPDAVIKVIVTSTGLKSPVVDVN